MRYSDDPNVDLHDGSKDPGAGAAADSTTYVADLQTDLNALGYNAGPVDGWFGSQTTRAVRAFQRDASETVRQTFGTGTSGVLSVETPPVYSGGVTGAVNGATAREIARWKTNRWQQPMPALRIEDVRDKLPINPKVAARLRRASDIDRLVLHCTDAPPTWNVYRCAQYDVGPNHISASGCPTITYAYFINADGSVQKCLSHDVISWHVGDWNSRALGIVLAYRATGAEMGPPAAQMQGAVALFASLVKELSLDPAAHVVGHRELLGTGYTIDPVTGARKQRKSCPGSKIDLDQFRSDVGRVVAGGQ